MMRDAITSSEFWNSEASRLRVVLLNYLYLGSVRQPPAPRMAVVEQVKMCCSSKVIGFAMASIGWIIYKALCGVTLVQSLPSDLKPGS